VSRHQLTLALHSEGIRGFDERICGILVLLLATTEKAEALAGILQLLLGL
jgi:hypothetical protein